MLKWKEGWSNEEERWVSSKKEKMYIICICINICHNFTFFCMDALTQQDYAKKIIITIMV